jgi:hypothetical protein
VLLAGVAAWLLAAPLGGRALAGDTAAVASKGEIVGILAIEAEGVSPTAADKFEGAIEEAIEGTADPFGRNFQVSPRVRLNDLLSRSSFAPGCRFGPCLKEIWRNTKVRLVLVGRVTSVGSSYTLLLSLMDTQSGMLTSQVVRSCPVCTFEDALSEATLAAISLVTGAGDAMVADPDTGPTSTESALDVRGRLGDQTTIVEQRRRSTRRAAIFFVGAGLIAAGAGSYLLATDKADVGYPIVAAGGVCAVASGTLFVLSRRF